MFQQAAANDQPILEQPATGGQQMQEANISSNQYYNQTQLPVRS